MKIIFFGSDDFALVHLKSLLGSAHQVVACVTQPDKAKGRGMKVIVSPIKECALKNNIPLLQPSTLKDAAVVQQLKGFKSDLFVVIAYGKFLPDELLRIPKICAINVHGSLLPKYRGAAPINWAIVKGEKETGISIINMNNIMDGGDIVAQRTIPIASDDTAVTLRTKMMQAGSFFLIETLDAIENDNYTLTAQDSRKATLAPKLTKELGSIQWERKVVDIHNLVRGLQPWPTAYTFCKGKLLKILETQLLDEDSPAGQSGQILKIDKNGLVVATGTKNLFIKKVHLQASKPMDAHTFVIGHQLDVGFRLG